MRLAIRTLACAGLVTVSQLAQAAPTPASGTLTEAGDQITFTGGPVSGVNQSPAAGQPVCVVPDTDCQIFDLAIEHAESTDSKVSISIDWTDELNDYDIYLVDAGGNVVGEAATAAKPETMSFSSLADGDYQIQMVPYLVIEDAEYTGVVAHNGAAASAPLESTAAGEPRVVVSVIDSAINPYHEFFYAGSDIYPDEAAPGAVDEHVLAAFGIADLPECQLTLTRTGEFDDDFNADADQWAAASACDVVWFVGTNLLAKSVSPGTIAYLPDDADDTHGFGVTGSVMFANPEAVVLFLEGTGAAAEEYAMTHPAVDIVTTSYGPVGSIPIPENLGNSFNGVFNFGKLHFGACDNSPSTAPQDGTCGPWWLSLIHI